MADTPKHSVSVAGIVVDEHNRVLVIQRRDNGHWEPPGGVLEQDETPEQGVVREVREETGFTVVVDELTGVYKNMPRAIIALVFRCHVESGSARLNEEVSHIRWMSLDEASAKMTPAYSIRLRDGLNGGVRVRAHDGVEVINV